MIINYYYYYYILLLSVKSLDIFIHSLKSEHSELTPRPIKVEGEA